jgi:hypothetical protein
MICPKCNENRAHRSRRSGFQDWAASLVFRIPYRCRACKARSYINPHGAGGLKFRSPEERRVIKMRRGLQVKKLKREIIAYGIGSLILLAILYYVFQQRIPTE